MNEKKIKEKKIKAWAVIRNEFIVNWLPDTAFTGALAIFENKKMAALAIKYNKELTEIGKQPKIKYNIVPCFISLKEEKNE